MLGVGGFQRSTITVKARRAENMGPIPIGEGERAMWTFSAERYTFKLQAWFVPHASPPPHADVAHRRMLTWPRLPCAAGGRAAAPERSPTCC